MMILSVILVTKLKHIMRIKPEYSETSCNLLKHNGSPITAS